MKVHLLTREGYMRDRTPYAIHYDGRLTYCGLIPKPDRTHVAKGIERATCLSCIRAHKKDFLS